MYKKHYSLILATTVLCSPMPITAEDALNVSELFSKGKAGVNFRYRLETVDQDGIAQNATASTLLTKLWYKTASYNGFSGTMEFTNTTSIGKENYNSTVNGNTTRPVVADPELTEINQAYLTYKNSFITLNAGRQGINLDNQRFIGTVGFRQNDQTYDAIQTTFTPVKKLETKYAYIWNVNRIFGNDHPLGDLDTNAHLFNASYSGLKVGKINAYGYLLDMNDTAVLGLSTSTFGASFKGASKVSDTIKIGYYAEYAKQADFKDSPLDYSADYWHFGASVSGSGLTAGVNYEVLGSDNGVGFSTPLATLHKFNGWSDKFLSTPGTGLRDIYGTISYKISGKSILTGTTVKAIYHEFNSDIGDIDYGNEWNFLIAKNINKTVNVALKAAFYNANTFASDTTKIWFTVGAKF